MFEGPDLMMLLLVLSMFFHVLVPILCFQYLFILLAMWMWIGILKLLPVFWDGAWGHH